jgi:hypothetical protein
MLLLLLLLLSKNGKALGICYRACLRAQVPLRKLTEKQKHKTRTTQRNNKAIQTNNRT